MQGVFKWLRYTGMVLLAVVFSWGIHELAHWLTATALGYEAVMTLNTVSLKNGAYQQDWHWILVSIMGPVVTIIQALVVYYRLVKKGWQPALFPFLLVAPYMRFLAGVMNLFNLNDEGRISHFLGIGDFTLSIIVSVFLGVLVFKASKKYKPGWKYQLLTLFLIMLFSTMLILSDQAWRIVLLPF
jgi:hypothetical protein